MSDGSNFPGVRGTRGWNIEAEHQGVEMIRPSNVLWSALVAAVSVVAGCGDDDGETLTKQEWLVSAEAICADMIAQEEEIGEPQTVEEMAAALEQFVEITDEGIDELKALSAPEGDEEVVAGIVEGFEGLAAAGGEFIEAVVASGSLDEMTPEVEAAFRDLEMAQQQAEETAGAYGLTGCFTDSGG
jgi:hypothetical protein